jgi:dienelactone hydrolase
MVWIHPGLTTFPRAVLELFARDGANPLRFLAAGYVLIVPTYRSRDADPQSTLPVDDLSAILAHARQLPYVDPASIVVYGCSGGGDLALEVAAATEVAAIVAEEPASFMFTGIFNKNSPKAGDLFTPEDTRPLGDNPTRFYTPEMRAFTRAKISRIHSPILVLQGTTNWVVPFNNQVLVPELRAAGKTLDVRSYPGEEHCFCFEGGGVPPPPFFKASQSWPRTALQAYRDIEGFVRSFLKTQPAPIDSRFVQEVAIKSP